MTSEPSVPLYGWVLQLDGDHPQLEFWAQCFPQRPVHIFEKASSFYCEADTLDELPDDSRIVFERGTELLQTAYAALRLWRSHLEPVKILFLIKRRADGSWGEPAGFTSVSWNGWASSVYFVEGHPNQSPAEMFMELANRDQRVRSALDDFASPSLDMSCLRRIAETIWTEFDPKDQGRAQNRMVADGLADRQPLERFFRTVNCGKQAAHSPFRFQKYTDSMRLGDAQEFLAGLLERWIRSKFRDTAT